MTYFLALSKDQWTIQHLCDIYIYIYYSSSPTCDLSITICSLVSKCDYDYPMWYDSTTRHLINRVRSARKKARLYQTPNNINKLERADQELSSHMFVTKANYETRLVSEFASQQQ